MQIEDVAKICHEANRALCEALGDLSQKPWAEAEEWQRDSAVKGVRYFIGHPTAPDSAQHDAWCNDKYAAGWTFGVEKDPTDKRHPCLVSFDQLPREQQAKDVLFKAVCRAIVPLLWPNV